MVEDTAKIYLSWCAFCSCEFENLPTFCSLILNSPRDTPWLGPCEGAYSLIEVPSLDRKAFASHGWAVTKELPFHPFFVLECRGDDMYDVLITKHYCVGFYHSRLRVCFSGWLLWPDGCWIITDGHSGVSMTRRRPTRLLPLETSNRRTLEEGVTGQEDLFFFAASALSHLQTENRCS